MGVKLLRLISPLQIVTKDRGQLALRDCLNWAQRQLVDTAQSQIDKGRPVRIITLKARQMGISTVIQALNFAMAMNMQNMRGLVIAHENESSEHLLSMSRNYWETYPLKRLYTIRYQAAKRLSWEETNSMIRVATAKNVRAGRSTTLHFVHSSECAFYDDAQTLFTGLGQTIPDIGLTFHFKESTANGLGNWFHTQWELAEAGDVEDIPLFFPWWKHPQYAFPGAKPDMPLDDEEKALVTLLKIEGLEDGEVDARLAWRRWAIKNKTNNSLEDFHQEYPSIPEEAFVATGKNVFPIQHLRQCYEPLPGIRGRLVREGERVRFQPDESGPLTIWKEPAEDLDWGKYIIGGDPTHTTEGDYACAQVINRRTWEQCAEWRAKVDPNTFGEEMAKLGIYYNQALLAPETEGPGYATIAKLLSLDYPHIWQHRLADKLPGVMDQRWGWTSTYKTKQEAVGNMLKLIVDHDFTFHSAALFGEAKNFVTLPTGYGNAAGEEGHDDTVMSTAITLTCMLYEAASLMAYGEGRSLIEQVGGMREEMELTPEWMSGWDNG